MSRSKRKTPIAGITTAESEKHDKAIWHRRHRHAEKSRLNVAGIEFVERSHKEHSNPWLMDKDGKKYYRQASAKALRK